MTGPGGLALLETAILSYFLAINAIYLIFTVIAAFDQLLHRLRGGRRDGRLLLSDSMYRPISILVPAHNEAATIIENLRSLLMLGYPEFEIVVINDGSDDDTLERLVATFELHPVPPAPRTALETRTVRQTYVSLTHPVLTVLDKERGGKSDALNAGINASRYPLFCTIDADSLLETDALLRLARAFAEDDRVEAAGGIIRVLNNAVVESGRVVRARAPSRPMLLCQAQEYVRGFLTGRSSLARLNALLIIAGAFGLFRKDAAVRVGGFTDRTVCEDMELVVRLHRRAREEKRGARVVFVPDPVCWTQVPHDWPSLIRQRDRWQRGLLQSLWAHRRMFLNPAYGTVGLVAMPFYTLFEALGPLIEIGGYLFVLALLAGGRLDPLFALLFFFLAVGCGVLLSVAALALEDLLFQRSGDTRQVAKMLGGAVLEYLGYRQFLALVRAGSFATLFIYGRRWGGQARRRRLTPAPEAGEP